MTAMVHVAMIKSTWQLSTPKDACQWLSTVICTIYYKEWADDHDFSVKRHLNSQALTCFATWQ